MIDPELPELDAEVVADDDLLVEIIGAAVRSFKMNDAWMTRLCEDRHFQVEMLRAVAPEASAQQLVVEEATGRLADHVVVSPAEPGRRARSRSTTSSRGA